jgi:lipopolysaccharide cholinephosphotransferase
MLLKYMRQELEDKYGFLEIQDKILEIMVYVDQFCEDRGIQYCLMGGSALGSKRHGGFIPWDDDLDIFMTPDNYEKFRSAFNCEGDKDRFYLQEWGLTDGMITIAKVRMNGTSFIEESLKNWDIHHGIYIDIFILHTCPNNRLSQLHQCFWAKYVITKGLALREQDRHSGIRGSVIKIARLFPERFLVKHALKQVYKYRNRITDYYCNFLGKAVFKKGIYKREWFDNPVYAPFETVQLKVPEKLHDFLVERFGDYMKPPSPDRIKYEQHAESWDFYHQKKITNEYKDERYLI